MAWIDLDGVVFAGEHATPGPYVLIRPGTRGHVRIVVGGERGKPCIHPVPEWPPGWSAADLEVGILVRRWDGEGVPAHSLDEWTAARADAIRVAMETTAPSAARWVRPKPPEPPRRAAHA